MTEQLKKLCGIPSPSGCEGEIREYIISRLGKGADYATDSLGNLIVHKKGRRTPKNKLMLCAHMDEVGFIVTAHTDTGLLKFANVGGISTEVIAGRQIDIGGVTGVVGVKPVHLCSAEERAKAVSFDSLTIDVGAKDKQSAEAAVPVGSYGVFVSDFVNLGNKLIKARGIDDKVGCAILLELINSPLPYDTTFVFTVQEEIGCRGAKAAAYSVAPDIAVVFEATTAADIAEVPSERKVCSLGAGPAVSFMDRSTLYDREIYDLIMRTAAEADVPCQPKAAVAGGNDAGSIHLSRGGVRTAAISVPCRYLHSASCVINRDDAEAALKLARAVIPKLAML